MSGTGSEWLMFGRLMRHKRKARGDTLKEAGAYIGCGTGTVSQWETGYTWPGPQYIPKTARYLEFTERDLVYLIYKDQRRRQKYVRRDRL